MLLGPKRTSELARQVGKLMAEFRKASNDFKFQFNEEMRVSDQQEQQKKQEAERAALGSGVPAENSILPPPGEALAAGEVSEPVPYAVSAVSATTGDESPVEDHPLLRVDVIPPMDGSPADQTSATAVMPAEGQVSGQVSGQELGQVGKQEEERASVHHG